MNSLPIQATLAALMLAVLLPIGSQTAEAAGVTVTDARVEAGKLVVTGRTSAVNQSR